MSNKPPPRQRPIRRRTPAQSNAKLKIQYEGRAKLAEAHSPENIVLYQGFFKWASLALIPITMGFMPEHSAEILKAFGLIAGIGGGSGLIKRLFGN